jgi:hypothetical protein
VGYRRSDLALLSLKSLVAALGLPRFLFEPFIRTPFGHVAEPVVRVDGQANLLSPICSRLSRHSLSDVILGALSDGPRLYTARPLLREVCSRFARRQRNEQMAMSAPN